jgi:hypothetical protein
MMEANQLLSAQWFTSVSLTTTELLMAQMLPAS